MRAFFWAIVFFCLVGGTIFLRAQAMPASSAPAADKQNARELALISFLTPAQQTQYATAREKALTDNPGLKDEGESLMNQAMSLNSDTPTADKQAFMQKMVAHRQKLRAAMLKEDGSLGPIFTAIDQHLAELKAKQLGQVQNQPGNSGSNSH